MNAQLILALLFAISPIMELRGSIPLLVDYALRHGQTYYSLIPLALLFNILTILLIFFFLDFLHFEFMKLTPYRRAWNYYIEKRLRKKISKVDSSQGITKYFVLFFFVALPLPGTGVWTSTTIAWILGMDKKKSFFTIALGAVLAGLIITLLSLGFFSILY